MSLFQISFCNSGLLIKFNSCNLFLLRKGNLLAEAAMTESLANDMWIVCGGPPTASPPPYEIAILMPSTPRLATTTTLQADSLNSSSDQPAPVSL